MFKYRIISSQNDSTVIYMDMILYDGESKSSTVESTKHLKPVYADEAGSIDIQYRQDWADFVDSIISIIRGHNFSIIDEHQSSISCSYYIQFYPVTEDGTTLDLIKIIFRLSDHRQKSSEEHSRSNTAILKSFVVNGKEYPTMTSVVFATMKICDGLQQGDYNDINRF